MKTDRRNGKILLVDDTPSAVGLVRTALENEGYVIFVATSGEKAIKRAELTVPDLILLDIMMPGMDGFETCIRLKALDKTRDVPVIFMSARTDTFDKVKGFNLGAVDYITKPIDTEELLSRVNTHLTIACLQRELKKINAELEERVSARTEELHVSNLQLKEEISERKQAEKAILKAKKDWERTFDTVPDLVAILDTDYRIVRVNKAMADRLGLTPEECVGQTCYCAVHGMDEPPSFCPHAQLLKDGREHMVEVREERLGGDFIISTSPIFDSEGHLTGSVHVARDITERKMLEDKLRQAYKMEAIGTLAGGIAHDFNNILAAIVGYTEMLESSIEKESLEYDYVTQVLKAGGRAKELVQQILAFSRESDHELKPIQIKFPIKEALKLIRASLPTTIEIRRDIQADTTVMADPTQIHQVIMNLCTNAGHAMREKGGTLDVSLRNADFGIENGDLGLGNGNLKSGIGLVPGPYVKLSVSDSGCGMPPHIVTRIFDPFFTTKEKGVGTGMGLSVVHGIVKSHGGAIDVYSEPGQGTTFNVFLPALESRSEAETRFDKPIPGGSENILFVDDEQMIADVIDRALKSLGYHVVTRTSSMEALELFQEEPDRFDIVITDMTMPKMTGRQLAEKLIQIRPNLPIILITGFSTAIDEETASAAGIRAIIFKPILKRDIAEAIRKVLDQKD